MIRKCIAACMLLCVFMGMTVAEKYEKKPSAKVTTEYGARAWLNDEEILIAKHLIYTAYDFSPLAQATKMGNFTYKREDYLLKVNILTGVEEVILEGHDVTFISYSREQNLCAMSVMHYDEEWISQKKRMYFLDMTTRELTDTSFAVSSPRISPNGEMIYVKGKGAGVYWVDTGTFDELVFPDGHRGGFNDWDKKTNEVVYEYPNGKRCDRYDPYQKKFYTNEVALVDAYSFEKDGIMYRSGTLYIKKETYPGMPIGYIPTDKKHGELSPDMKKVLTRNGVYGIAKNEEILKFPKRKEQYYQGELP